MATLVLSAIFTLLLAALVGAALKLSASRPGKHLPGKDDADLRGPGKEQPPEP